MRVPGEPDGVLPVAIATLHRSVYFSLDISIQIGAPSVNRSVYPTVSNELLRRQARHVAAPCPERRDHLALHGVAPEPGHLHAADDCRTRHLGRDVRLLDRIAEHRLGPV